MQSIGFTRICSVWWVVISAALVASPAVARETREKLDRKVSDAAEVYQELLQTPDREIPERLLEDCRCIAVIPHVIKGAIGYGARFGQGVVTCRGDSGRWSPLAFLRLTGGSFGFQIGGQSTDYVLFFMTEHGARSLLESKFTLGGKLSVAAGPVGRSAEADTDIKLDAAIYSYAKSKGLFAGISLEGARLAPDGKAIEAYYGERLSPESILFERGVTSVPKESREFLELLP
jgi:lipid-binding SYLF domain-containing protein